MAIFGYINSYQIFLLGSVLGSTIDFWVVLWVSFLGVGFCLWCGLSLSLVWIIGNNRSPSSFISFAESHPSASNFFLIHFRKNGIFLGILFTKNSSQNALQGISAERLRIVNRVQASCDGTAERVGEQNPKFAGRAVGFDDTDNQCVMLLRHAP